MKIKYAFYLLACISISCKTPAYLPHSENLGENVYGSYLKVSDSLGNQIKGELISVENDSLFILQNENELKSLVALRQDKVARFKIKYANSDNYGWAMITHTIGCVFPVPDPESGDIMPLHGFFAIITVPVNLIVTSVIYASARNDFRYNKNDLTFNDLKKFARFPQGIPVQVNRSDIK